MTVASKQSVGLAAQGLDGCSALRLARGKPIQSRETPRPPGEFDDGLLSRGSWFEFNAAHFFLVAQEFHGATERQRLDGVAALR